jgi:tetratricopeptide (TPR) repeat protein
MSKRTMILCVAAVIAGRAEGQNQAVIAAQPSRYEQPTCELLREGNFKVKSGATYVKSALESATNRDRLLSDADRVLREAIVQNGQGTSPMAWYWLGRVYLYRGDVSGADSSLRKAEELAPDCTDDFRKVRVPVYAALLKPAGEYMQASKHDSALVLLKQGASFYPAGPYAYQNMGIIYYNTNQFDSAAANFEKAIAAADTRAATDTAYATMRAQTTFNLAAVYQNMGRHQDAITALNRYLTWNPSDNDARRALANSYRATGKVDSAQAIESQLLSSADAPGAPGAGVSGVDAFDLGVKAFNDKNYEDAATAFQQSLKDDPRYRDALFNLANTYLQLNNADSLVAVGERLVALDPMNESSLRLLARGYQMKKNQEQTLKYVGLVSELLVNVEVTAVQLGANSATLTGSATGRAAKDLSEKPIAPAPLTLVFEFLDAQGGVVNTQEVAINQLAEGAKQDFTLNAQAPGITAWRYKKK